MGSGEGANPEGGRGNFSAALSCAEFRAMWAAEALSVVGDQLARVALALVVFDRTSSASLTELTYALTFAPSVLGGFFLSRLADRYARRAVIVSTDVVRSGLAIAMALPGLPLPAMWCLVGVLTLVGAPFKGGAARAASGRSSRGSPPDGTRLAPGHDADRPGGWFRLGWASGSAARSRTGSCDQRRNVSAERRKARRSAFRCALSFVIGGADKPFAEPGNRLDAGAKSSENRVVRIPQGQHFGVLRTRARCPLWKRQRARARAVAPA